MQIRIGHSPDPDDAFMFWALAEGAVDDGGFEFEFVTEDIQTLNEWALEARLDVTAISLATYPLVQDRYVLLPHGASMGSGYGPVVVAQRELSLSELREFMYWLFKYRVRMCEPARVASDTRKALAQLSAMEDAVRRSGRRTSRARVEAEEVVAE